MDSITHQAPSSSITTSSSQTSSSSSSTQYDVFLNFRGLDTRNKFTSHLYAALVNHGIITYMDTPDLPTGEEIEKSLMEAIRKSEIYIVVLSENYAHSSWCLKELVEILKYHTTMHRLVVPVYCHIDPSVVRYQTGTFEKDFKNHESRADKIQKSADKRLEAVSVGRKKKRKRRKRKRLEGAAEMEKVSPEQAAAARKDAAIENKQVAADIEKINTWRNKLKEVAAISGKHISQHRSEADVIKEIIDLVLPLKNPKALAGAEHPVGLESRVEEITALLKSTEGVTRIGIYGMGGMGKTTLAKALYNQLLRGGSFQGSCFLENVREVWQNREGPESLKKKLINGLFNRKIEFHNADRTMYIKEKFKSLKVLLLIDDLDDLVQYGSLVGEFASGSVVIITTEMVKILDDIQVEHRHQVKLLNEAESEELFTLHAFRGTEPDKTFLKMSNDLLYHAAGLPLALVVFGSYLRSEPKKEGWIWFIDSLKEHPNAKVDDKFAISLEALKKFQPELHEIFLDIACFFNEKKKKTVVKIMKTYYANIDHSIDILENRCLLTINKEEKLKIHSLLQHMGRKVARNNSHKEPGKYSRLWEFEHIHDVLENQKGTDTIQGIVHQDFGNQDAFRKASYAAKAFKTMSNLRFLHLPGVILTGSYQKTFKDLKWFRWDCCPLPNLPSRLCPQKLVILELPCGEMTAMWKQNSTSKIQDFTQLPLLETLNLKGCKYLEDVHISIGSLVKLVDLNLRGCAKLRSLPNTICDLRVLEVLNICNCSGLVELPEKLGNIQSLKELIAGGLNVSILPNSIGRLSKLVELSLRDNNKLKILPDSICNLVSLEILDISGCEKLEVLPDKLRNFTKLMKLDASGASLLRKLPNLSKLKHLKTLDLTDCSCLTAIQGLEELTSLRELHLGGCTPSILEVTLTERFFQICSAFGSEIQVTTTELPGWINSESSVAVEPDMAHNFLGMILCFKDYEHNEILHNIIDLMDLATGMLIPGPIRGLLNITLEILRSRITYSVKNITSGFVWSGSCSRIFRKSLMVVVPSSIFPVRDGDDRIELTKSDARNRGIHLLYKTESESVSRSIRKVDCSPSLPPTVLHTGKMRKIDKGN